MENKYSPEDDPLQVMVKQHVEKILSTQVATVTHMQRAIIITYCLILIAICFYVPWEAKLTTNGNSLTQFIGFSWFWQPPFVSKLDPYWWKFSNIDFRRIIFEVFGATVIAGIAYFAFGKSSKR
ncbi:hypothetical protein M7775_17225 [Sporomusa sphaeroides DSM 2875]|uniref:hypothetical protein n=1 Tax=Sporomusa sphaeroides TaxID=47679 RepID=UPI00202E026C|nr:hypothetical protein [Sporomusa sphaeroides]MCM0760298.1 hypothetical protein [Sporomusa sphaeroides DSM 2875]